MRQFPPISSLGFSNNIVVHPNGGPSCPRQREETQMSKPTVRQYLPGLSAAALVLSLAPALVQAQTPPVLDHFKCYRTTGAPPDVVVGLRDQFDVPGVAPDKTFVRFPVK